MNSEKGGGSIKYLQEELLWVRLFLIIKNSKKYSQRSIHSISTFLTSMWSRFLRDQILYPLQDIKEIEKRQDFIEEFYNNPVLLDRVQKKLKGVSDIDAILNRIALNRAWVRDLTHLKKSLQAIVEALDIIKNQGSKKLNSILSNLD